MFELIINNLQNVTFGELLFIGAYLGNMLISLWYNIGVLKQSFDKTKVQKSILKILCFGGGIGITSIVISTLPIFASSVGFVIPGELADSFAIITVIGMFLTSACIYVAEAVSKAKKILIKDNSTK